MEYAESVDRAGVMAHAGMPASARPPCLRQSDAAGMESDVRVVSSLKALLQLVCIILPICATCILPSLPFTGLCCRSALIMLGRHYRHRCSPRCAHPALAMLPCLVPYRFSARFRGYLCSGPGRIFIASMT